MGTPNTEKKEPIPLMPAALKEANLITQQEWDNAFSHSGDEDLESYCQIARQAKALTDEEASALIRGLHNGNKDILHTLIDAYTPLAYVMAYRSSRFTRLSFSDIILYGSVPGLLKAINDYDPDSEMAFSVFCYKHIRMSMLRFFGDHPITK